MADCKAKDERLKIADMNEKAADAMIEGLKEELTDSKGAAAQLKEYKTEHDKAMKKLIGLMTLTLTLTRRCCLLYTSPSPRDRTRSRMPSSA